MSYLILDCKSKILCKWAMNTMKSLKSYCSTCFQRRVYVTYHLTMYFVAFLPNILLKLSGAGFVKHHKITKIMVLNEANYTLVYIFYHTSTCYWPLIGFQGNLWTTSIKAIYILGEPVCPGLNSRNALGMLHDYFQKNIFYYNQKSCKLI